MGNPYTNGSNLPKASDIYSGVQNLIGGTTMAGEAMAAGLGGLGGAVLGQWINPMMGGRGFGMGGFGTGVGDTGTQTILNQDLINNRFDQIVQNNDTQTAVITNNNTMKVLSDLGIQVALNGGIAEQAKDAAVSAGAQAVLASQTAGEKASTASYNSSSTILASLNGVSKDLTTVATMNAKDTVNALTNVATANSLASGLAFRELQVQGIQTKYEASILADMNARTLMDKIRDSMDLTKEEGCKTRALIEHNEMCALRAENLKLSNHIQLEEEFEEHDRKRGRRDSEITNVNVNNNNTQIQNQISDLTTVVRSLLLSGRPIVS